MLYKVFTALIFYSLIYISLKHSKQKLFKLYLSKSGWECSDNGIWSVPTILASSS